MERRLRKNTEEKLRRAEEGRRAAERERDLFRVSKLITCCCDHMYVVLFAYTLSGILYVNRLLCCG